MNKENQPRTRPNKFGYRGSIRKSAVAEDLINGDVSPNGSDIHPSSNLPPGSDQGLKSLLDGAQPPVSVVALREARPLRRMKPIKDQFATTPDNIIDACKTIRDKYGSFKEKEVLRREAQRLLKETWSVTIPGVLEEAVEIEDELLVDRENLVHQISSVANQRNALQMALADTKQNLLAVPALERKIAESEKSRKTLQGVLNVITESKERAERENESFRGVIQEHRGMQTELEGHLSSIEYELGKQSKMRAALEKDHASQIQNAAADTQAALSEQQAKNQHEIRRLKAEHALEIEAKDNLVKVTSGQVNGANQKVDELKANMSAMIQKTKDEVIVKEKQKAALLAKVESLQDSCTRANDQCAALQLSLDTERQNYLEKDKQLEVGMRTFEVTQRTMDQEKRDLLMEKRQLQQLLTESNKKLESVKDIQQLANQRESELQSTRQELLELKYSVSENAGAKAETQSENLKLEGQLSYVKEQVDKTMKELQELRDEHSRASESITVERVYLQAEANRLKDEKASGSQKAEKEIATLRGQLEALETDLSNANNQRDEATSELKILRENRGNDGAGQMSSEQMERLMRLQVEADQLRRQVEESKRATSAVDNIHQQQKQLEERLFDSEAQRRKLHNLVQDLRGNVRVFVRIRPSFEDSMPSALKCIDREKLCIASQGFESVEEGTGTLSNFQYDRVFGGECNQSDVFGDVSDLIQSSLDGYNVCLFSYGQTGSGKTFTMEGTGDGPSRGLIPRSAEKIMEETMRLKTSGWDHTISASFAEIYNEELRDLLLPSGSQRPELSIKMQADGKPHVTGLVEETVDRMDHIHDIMGRASTNRAVASTDMNSRSSRSHSIFILRIRGVNEQKKISLSGTLNLCDLAGSERLARSHATGDRLKETQAINKSLSALVDVFDALKRKNSHIPFRNSKLTYLLQDCLSGDGKTMMLVNLSPDVSSSNESLCSLKFASQVNQTELGKAKRQVENGHAGATAVPLSQPTTPRSQPRTSSSRPSGGSLKAPARSSRLSRSSLRPHR